MLETVSSLQFVMFGSTQKMMFTKLLLDKEVDDGNR